MADETRGIHYAAAAEAEVRQVSPGEAPFASRDQIAPHRDLPNLQGASDGAPGLPRVREVSGQGRPAPSGTRTGQLNTDAEPGPFLAFGEGVKADRAFVFPGQGAQSVGMGKDLYEQFPAARELYERADQLLGFRLSRICFEGPEEDLQQTRNTQPAIAVTSLALLRVATELNPALLSARPAFVAGHSLGEYSALVAAGSLSFDDAILLLRARGELMQQAGERNPGTMAAVLGLDFADCEDVCREAGAEICNINAPGQIVIGGRRDDVVRAMDYAKARGAMKVIPLSVSGAFHSSLMRPAAEGMVVRIGTATVNPATVPVVANCTAAPITGELDLRHELIDQVCRPVQWSRTVEFLGGHGVSTFIEFGPGRVLTGIIKRMQRKATCINVTDAASTTVAL
jgi:[acyl-carrier-protein] S-malonyltransferase